MWPPVSAVSYRIRPKRCSSSGGGAAGTPGAIVGKLNSEIDRAIASPDMRKAFAERGVYVRPGTAAQFEAFLVSERAKWQRAVKDSGATVD